MSEIKLNMSIQTAKEVWVEGPDIQVSVNPWSSMEGASVMMHGKGDGGLALRAAFAARWEELDVLMMAITAARSA